MKNLLLLIAVTFSLNTIAQVPNYVPTNGLVGYWPFDGNANDESGNGNNGTVNGATLIADRFGNTNAAYSFDGTNDYILVNGLPTNYTSYTIAAWAEANVINQIISGIAVQTGKKNGTKYGSYGIRARDQGDRFIGVHRNAAETLQGIDPLIPQSINLHHYVQTWTGSAVHLYLDGVLVKTVNIPTIGIVSTEFCVGALFGSSIASFFNGSVDDVGVWSRALNECEIQGLYSSQLNSTSVDAGINQTICNGDPVTLAASNSMNYSWNNSVVDGAPFSPTATSNYIVTADSAGCTSIDSLTVTVNQPTSSSINETATDTYTSPSGIVYDTSGVYNDTIPNTMNCDSVITINLTMEYTGINEYNSSLISLFPNPASNQITINGLNDLTDITKIEITSITGAIVRKENITNSVIDISVLNSGMYLLFISHENGFEKISFLKE